MTKWEQFWRRLEVWQGKDDITLADWKCGQYYIWMHDRQQRALTRRGFA